MCILNWEAILTSHFLSRRCSVVHLSEDVHWCQGHNKYQQHINDTLSITPYRRMSENQLFCLIQELFLKWYVLMKCRDHDETKCLHLYVHLNTLVSTWIFFLIQKPVVTLFLEWLCITITVILILHGLNSFKPEVHNLSTKLKAGQRERCTREVYLYVNTPTGNQTEKLQLNCLFGTDKHEISYIN